MAFYSAYFDESSGNDSPILVVAGLLSTDAQWGLFEKEWKEILTEFRIKAFHDSHFATRKKGFRGMQESTRQALLAKLLDVVTRRAQLGFGAVIHLAAFEDVFQGPERTDIGSPYKLACTACFLEIGEWAKRNYQIKPVSYIFDSGNVHSNELSQHFLESKKNVEYRLGSLTFESDEVLVPLQAADLAAYELWKWLDEHFATKTMRGRFPLKEVVKIGWNIREFDRSVLEELRTQRRGGRVDKKVIRHVISAPRPGEKWEK
jgi:hypothetical protein